MWRGWRSVKALGNSRYWRTFTYLGKVHTAPAGFPEASGGILSAPLGALRPLKKSLDALTVSPPSLGQRMRSPKDLPSYRKTSNGFSLTRGESTAAF